MGAHVAPASSTAGYDRSFSIQSARIHAGIMLSVRGELDLATAPVVEGELQRVEAEHEVVAIDLRQVDFIDSSGLHVLIKARERAAGSGRRLVLLQGSPQVRRVLSLTGLVDQMEVMDDPGEIVAD
jgi:anti-sigma B factor antagonist